MHSFSYGSILTNVEHFPSVKHIFRILPPKNNKNTHNSNHENMVNCDHYKREIFDILLVMYGKVFL